MPKTVARAALYLAVGALFGSGVATLAQAQLPLPRPRDSRDARIVTSPDVGFRVDGTDPRTGRPVGTLVIRVNGEWVETSASQGIQLAK